MNRREFHKLSLAAAITPLFAPGAAFAQAPAAKQRFAVMLWILSKTAPLEQRLETLAAAGYDSGELVLEWRDWTAAQRASIVAKKNELKLGFDVMFPSSTPLTDATARTKLQDEIKAAIPIAHEIGCNRFSFKSGPRVAGISQEQHNAVIADSLKAAIDASENKFEMLLEPIDVIEDKRQAINSVSDAFAVTRAVGNPQLKVLYDFYHEQRGSGNMMEKLEKNFDQVGLVHIADVPGRHRPGTGEIDYPNIYRKLAALNYTGYITMEFYTEGDQVAELKAAKQEALTAMQKS
jgi:hydroxypyruvate isomerase